MDKSTRRLPPGPKGRFLVGSARLHHPVYARVWGYREAAACQPRGLSPESPRLHGVRPRHASPQLRQELVLLASRESGVWERPPHERRGFLVARAPPMPTGFPSRANQKSPSLVRRPLPNTAFTSEGDFWLRERRLCQPAI